MLTPAQHVLAGLKAAGVNLVATLPETWLHELIARVDADPDIVHVPVTREEEGVGICAGAYLVGLRPVLLVQNSGLLNSCNALVTLNQLYQIPLLMLVSLRGDLGEPIFFHMPLGRWTVPVLDALRIPHWVVQTPEEAETVVVDAMTSALSSRLPAAVLLTRKTTYQGEH